MLDALQQRFFRVGWLMPVIFPLAEIGGRGLFNSLAGIYVLWGGMALVRSRPVMDRAVGLSYGLLLLAFLLSAVQAADAGAVLKDWARYALHTLAFVFTLAALQRNGQGMAILFNAYGKAALATLAVVYALLPWQVTQDDFNPTGYLREDNLPFLAPFLLYWVMRRVPLRWRWPSLVFAGTVLLVYVAASQGRAALLGLLVAGGIATWLLAGRGRWKIFLAGAIVAALAVMANPDRFSRGILHEDAANKGSWVEMLDRFSSFRISIWRTAIEHPPESLWTGIGMGQVKHSATGEGLEQFVARHFHNFLLDCWYETGFIGLAALLLFVGLGFVRGVKVWHESQGEPAIQSVLLLVSAAALVAAALLSFSYTSRQFSLYLFVLLAAMHHLYYQRHAGAKE